MFTRHTDACPAPDAPRPAVNPYLDLPLPIGVRIDWGFWPDMDAHEARDAVRGVVRALNALAYLE